MPVAAVQRNAPPPEAGEPLPTTTVPSSETPVALLLKLPPGRSPSGMNSAAWVADSSITAATGATNAREN